jgi:hypothetical protein
VGVPTGDGPALDLSVLARKPGEPDAIELDPYTVELLCGGTCRWCRDAQRELDRLFAENTKLRGKVAELETRRAYADVGGG